MTGLPYLLIAAAAGAMFLAIARHETAIARARTGRTQIGDRW